LRRRDAAGFADPDFPAIGADMIAEPVADDPDMRIVCLVSMTDFDPENVAILIQRCCAHALAKGPIRRPEPAP
jgi:hypothetical protein